MTATRPAAIDGGDALDGPQHCLSTDPFGDDQPATHAPAPTIADLAADWAHAHRDATDPTLPADHRAAAAQAARDHTAAILDLITGDADTEAA